MNNIMNNIMNNGIFTNFDQKETHGCDPSRMISSLTVWELEVVYELSEGGALFCFIFLVAAENSANSAKLTLSGITPSSFKYESPDALILILTLGQRCWTCRQSFDPSAPTTEGFESQRLQRSKVSRVFFKCIEVKTYILSSMVCFLDPYTCNPRTGNQGY